MQNDILSPHSGLPYDDNDDINRCFHSFNPLDTMRFPFLAISFLLILPATVDAQKDNAIKAASNHADANWPTALKLWEFAEPGYQEKQSADALAAVAEKAGFTVKKGVAGIPTAFTAEFGSGKPTIGIMGEFDALPEMSQEAVPFRKPREGGNGYGHACGHHLFGVASLTAAIAIGEQIKEGKIKGTVRFYMCPAEEGGSAKVFMARAGLFDDCDTVLHWHPGSQNAAGDATCLARIAAKFRYHGIPSHASAAPEKGRSALDALVLAMHAVELMREHTPDGTRLHHTITSGGGAPNVVPAFAEGFFYVRHPKSEIVKQLYPRLLKCAQAGALATETKLEVVYLGGTMEILPNNTLAQLAMKNLTALNDLKYDADELKFALRIQETIPDKMPLDGISKVFDISGKSSGGSTDVGDVSWIVPVTGFSTACWVPGTPAHSWQAVACGGTTIGKKGMNLAARTLAATAWDLFTDPQLIKDARTEHVKRLDGRKYEAMLEKDQAPPLDYRNAPKLSARD
jgi:aminobenzoyl-glutamate utilization protein B